MLKVEGKWVEWGAVTINELKAQIALNTVGIHTICSKIHSELLSPETEIWAKNWVHTKWPWYVFREKSDADRKWSFD